jgi:hypothetical protein
MGLGDRCRAVVVELANESELAVVRVEPVQDDRAAFLAPQKLCATGTRPQAGLLLDRDGREVEDGLTVQCKGEPAAGAYTRVSVSPPRAATPQSRAVDGA